MTEGILRAFIPSFPLAALAAFLLVPIARRLAPSIGFIDHPRADRFHSRPVPLLGGPTCLAAALLGSIGGWIVLGRSWGSAAAPVPGGVTMAAVFGTIALAGLGLADDRRALPPLRKGMAMGGILAITILLWRPSGSLGGPLGWTITWVGAMVVVNAWNYLDHADGIFATAAGIATAVLACAAWKAGEAVPAATLAALSGCLLGYLIWNAPPARIFLGDSGSLPLGLLIFMGGASLIDSAPPSIRPAVIASSAIPIIDLSLVTITRLRRRRNPFRGGREHTGHRLTDRFGPRWAVIIVACASLLFGAAGLLLGPGRDGLAVSIIGACGLLFLAGLGRIPPPA